MTSILNFKNIVDLPKWRTLTPSLISGGSVIAIVSDLRNNRDNDPFVYLIFLTNTFHKYSVKTDEWTSIGSPSLASSISVSFIMPGQGPRGTIGAGGTTSSIPLGNVLPLTVGVNQLANRGDGIGFKIRIIGNSAGSSGKIEERYIVANTGQTTLPVLTLDSPLSFIPANGDAYEFLSGRVFMLGTSNTPGSWKYYDILTNSFSGSLSVTNLAASSDNSLVGLDELLVPYDRNPGEGFLGTLVATASGATSLTGQVAGGDTGVVANQYRNFQIRIVQDTATPTAVGQRRNITSHTGGPSPVYTVPAWAVQPSTTATYVIENNGDRIIEWSSGSTQTSTYTISTNTWDANTTFAARPAAPTSGLMSVQSFGIEPDIANPPNARHSFIYSFRGGSTTTLDLFDISGAATGVWTSTITYGNIGTLINLGGFTYDPATNQGRYMYIMPTQGAAVTRFYRFDTKNRVMEPMTSLRWVNPSGTLSTPIKLLAGALFVDGNIKIAFLIYYGILNITTQTMGGFCLPITA